MKTPINLITCGFIVICTAAKGQVIYDANFNSQPLGPLATGTAPNLPPSVLIDPGATVNVVQSAGNLTDRPVVLHPVIGGLACAAFYNPSVLSSGDWRVSWDSLVLGMPSNDPLEQGNIQLGGGGATMWGIKYLPGGQFSVEDSGGFHSTGSFAIGQSSHFDLDLHLGSETYQLSLNNVGVLSGGLAANGAFDLTYFRSNGRTGLELPDMAFDNFRVVAVPEPSVLALTGGASVLFLAVRLRKRAKQLADIRDESGIEPAFRLDRFYFTKTYLVGP